MPLATEVGLGSGDIVLHWDSAPHGKGQRSPPLFGPLCSGTVANIPITEGDAEAYILRATGQWPLVSSVRTTHMSTGRVQWTRVSKITPMFTGRIGHQRIQHGPWTQV